MYKYRLTAFDMIPWSWDLIASDDRPCHCAEKAKVWKKGSFRVSGQSKDLSAADAISHFVARVDEWAANPRREAEVSVDYTRFATEGDEGTAFRLTFECSDAKGLPRITTVKDLLCD